MKKNKKDLILVSGGTSSGKTTIVNNIAKDLQRKGKKVTVFSMDNYYFEINHWKGKDQKEINWDEPSAIDWELLKKDLLKLLNGQAVTKKVFEYETNKYSKNKVIKYLPNEVIICEGIFGLYDEYLLKNSSYKVFVDADSDIRFIRRLQRDTKRHSSYDLKTSVKLWIDNIKPMHDKWIEPQKKLANVILLNNNETFDLKELNPLNWFIKH